MPGFGVISTTSDTFSPAAAPAVAGGVVIAACFQRSPPRNCSDGALWTNTTLDQHRTARSVLPITVRLYLENHRAHKSAQGQVFLSWLLAFTVSWLHTKCSRRRRLLRRPARPSCRQSRRQCRRRPPSIRRQSSRSVSSRDPGAVQAG